jgi:hypothetical protein
MMFHVKHLFAEQAFAQLLLMVFWFTFWPDVSRETYVRAGQAMFAIGGGANVSRETSRSASSVVGHFEFFPEAGRGARKGWLFCGRWVFRDGQCVWLSVVGCALVGE